MKELLCELDEPAEGSVSRDAEAQREGVEEAEQAPLCSDDRDSMLRRAASRNARPQRSPYFVHLGEPDRKQIRH